MRFDILTIFPNIFDSYFNESILKRAQVRKLIDIKIHNIRDTAVGKHKMTDDKPYGGGAGMVMMAEPVLRTIEKLKIKNKNSSTKQKIIVLSAKGKQFTQKTAYQWAKKYNNVILISGRYEGVDERVKKALKAEEISIGPYVTTDGDVGAMMIVSAIARLIPGVIRLESLEEESHWNKLVKNETEKEALEYPHYTRPEVLEYKKKKYRVPKVLLSGDHKKIAEWRRQHRK
jgi:tRNA (guanine37-N1)-methyltransferase